MKNPCEKCLVRTMCFATVCKDLNLYLYELAKENKIDINNYIPVWIKKYEIRPRVIEYAEQFGFRARDKQSL